MHGDSRPRSPLSMVLLALVAEAPLHPYGMQQLIKERGRDAVANVAQPNSVYQTIDRLRRSELIAVRETSRAERRPERTVYEITELGRATLARWLRTMLAEPQRDFPDFPAALSFLCLLGPDDAARRLEERARALGARLAELDAGVPRPLAIEDAYRRATTLAELAWVRGLVEDLRAGRRTWNREGSMGSMEAPGA
ncbi:MAG TPA: PadR family transcriptional regulator [Candidatus Dormibacteraeota bacterium]